MPGQDPTQQFLEQRLAQDLTGSGSASAEDAAERAAFKSIDKLTRSDFEGDVARVKEELRKSHDRRNEQLAEAFKEKTAIETKQTTKRQILRKAIEHTINCESIDTMANTPDFIIAEFLDYMLGGMLSFNEHREKWFGSGLRINGPVKLKPMDPEFCDHRRVILSEGPHAECYDCKSVMDYDPESRNWKVGKPCPTEPPIQIAPPDPEPAGMPPPLAGTILDPEMHKGEYLFNADNPIPTEGISCPHCGWKPESVVPTPGLTLEGPVLCPNCRQASQFSGWLANGVSPARAKALAIAFGGVKERMDAETAAAATTLGDELVTKIFEAVGAASMCWNPRPGSQVFDTTEALAVARALIRDIARVIVNGRPETAEEAKQPL